METQTQSVITARFGKRVVEYPVTLLRRLQQERYCQQKLETPRNATETEVLMAEAESIRRATQNVLREYERLCTERAKREQQR